MAAQPKATVVTELKETKNALMMVDPFKLHIVGVDKEPDGAIAAPGAPYYDERINLPLDPDLEESIRTHGVVTPILAKRDGERYIVINGRRRVLHTRAVNLKVPVDSPETAYVRVPTVFRGGEVGTLESLGNITNTYDVKDPVWVQAIKIQRATDRGGSKESICRDFNISGQTYDDRIRIMSLGPEAMDALKAGELSANAALFLSDINAAAQITALREARDTAIEQGKRDGKLTSRVVANAVANNRNAGTSNTAQRRTPKEVVADVKKEIDNIIRGVAESGKPMGADKRTASMPEPAAMFAALRKITALVNEGKKYDTLVKAAIPKPDESDEDEKPAKPAKAEKADK